MLGGGGSGSGFAAGRRAGSRKMDKIPGERFAGGFVGEEVVRK